MREFDGDVGNHDGFVTFREYLTGMLKARRYNEKETATNWGEGMDTRQGGGWESKDVSYDE